MAAIRLSELTRYEFCAPPRAAATNRYSFSRLIEIRTANRCFASIGYYLEGEPAEMYSSAKGHPFTQAAAHQAFLVLHPRFASKCAGRLQLSASDSTVRRSAIAASRLWREQRYVV